MTINTEIYKFCVKAVQPLLFHVINIVNACFMLERKSFSDLQSSEVFDDILFENRKFWFCLIPP